MSTANHAQALKHKAAFRLRRKNGLEPLPKPWDWLDAAQVKEIALKAYYVATHGLLEDVQFGQLSEQELRQSFAESLTDVFRDLVIADAVTRGGCWPVDANTPPFRNYPQIAANMCADLPKDWKPQYPVYQEVTPASATNTPGVVINANEVNINEQDFMPSGAATPCPSAALRGRIGH